MEDFKINFYDEVYEAKWSEHGCLENPNWYYSLSHSDASIDIYDMKLNEYVLFGLAAESFENKWYGGFYYNPIPSDEKENVSHYYPVSYSLHPGFDTQEEAVLWALNMFFTMYDSIGFQFKVFIYKSLLAYATGNEWLMVVNDKAVSEKINETYGQAMIVAQKLFDRKQRELEQAKRAFQSFM